MAAIIPANVPKNVNMRNNVDVMSTTMSKARTFWMSIFARRNKMAHAENIPANM
jgi:hypothetical protein